MYAYALDFRANSKILLDSLRGVLVKAQALTKNTSSNCWRQVQVREIHRTNNKILMAPQASKIPAGQGNTETFEVLGSVALNSHQTLQPNARRNIRKKTTDISKESESGETKQGEIYASEFKHWRKTKRATPKARESKF
jgi:hypothetical protein